MTLRALHPWWILVIGFAGVCVYAYPGYMSYDSLDQLQQARAGVYGDWHPPLMAALWRLCEHVVAGPLGMLVIQLSVFLAGAFLMMRRWLAPTGAAIAAVGLLWFPPIATLMAVIWKDSQMLAFLLLGVGLLLRERRGAQLGGLLALVIASALRHNGFTITLPIVVLLVQVAKLTGVRRYASAVAVWLVITAASFGIDRALTDTEQHPWTASLALTDITGIIRYAPPMTDAEILSTLDGTPLVATHDLQLAMTRAYDPMDPLRIFDRHVWALPTTDAQRDAITRAWKSLLLAHPGAYLRARERALYCMNYLPNRHGPENQVFVRWSPAFPDVWPRQPTDWRTPLQRTADRVGKSWLCRPWAYLYLLALLSPLWIRSRDRALIAMVLSILTCEAALFLVAPAATYRYLAWLTVVAVTTCIALATRAARRR